MANIGLSACRLPDPHFATTDMRLLAQAIRGDHVIVQLQDLNF